MKLTWTSPDQIPAIRRWGVLPLFFAGAGIAGGVIGAVLTSRWAEFTGDDYVTVWVVLGGGLGLGSGLAVLLCSRAWLGVLAAPGTGMIAVLCGVVILRAANGDFHRVRDLWREVIKAPSEPFWWIFVAAPSVFLTLAHRIVLVTRRPRLWVMISVYASGGLLWGFVVVWWKAMDPSRVDPDRGLIPMAILQCALIGLFQWGGMIAAQKFSGVAGPSPDPATSSDLPTAFGPAPEEAGRTPSS